MTSVFRRMHWGIVALVLLGGVDLQAQASLDAMLKPYLSRYQLPALAAAVVKDGKIVAAGAVGTRRWGTVAPVTLNDRFHLGSDTKAMTALLAAMLVDQGRLRWNSTSAEVFPELAPQMDPIFKQLTLEQMLSHTSGLPSDNESRLAEPYLKLILDDDAFAEGNLDEIRYGLLERWARLPVPGKPGERFEYSNLNYTIVGTMIERLERRTWDELMVEKVFKPLKLSTAGLGTQSSLGRVDAPLGHRIVDGVPKAMLAGPRSDNPSVIGPAGIAHMSILDFARWAGWNAGEGRRGPALVKAQTLKKLHAPVTSVVPLKDVPAGTPPPGHYALGWGSVMTAFHPNPVLSHAGSNGLNLAKINVDPQADFAVVLLSNIAGKPCDEGMKALTKELFEKYAPKRTRPRQVLKPQGSTP